MKQEKTLSDKIVKQDLYYTKTGGMINDFIFTEDVKEAISKLKKELCYLVMPNQEVNGICDDCLICNKINEVFGSRLVEEK